MTEFKVGDRVRMKIKDSYVHGEITIIRTNDGFYRSIPKDEIICKVIFDEEWAPDYWYYPKTDLELIKINES